VEVQWSREQDHVIQRADGTCLYHLANVVDDHDLEISHVIRAEEHLSNTPRQIFIAQSLGYELPIYAHLPFVAEPGSKNKLSKRKLDKYLKNCDFANLMKHGRKVADALGLHTNPDTFNPVVVDFYEQVGYLPEAITNYLALLGWSLDDKTEDLPRDRLVECFSLDRVGKSAASFDPKKLWAFQDRHMQRLPAQEKLAMVTPYLQQASLVPDPASKQITARIAHVLTAAGDRIKTAGDILDYQYFFLDDDDLTYDEKALTKAFHKAGAGKLLMRYRQRLAAAEAFDAESLDHMTHHFIHSEEVKIGDIIHSVRVAVTGQAIGLGLFDSLAILGKESCLARIDKTLHRTAAMQS
jgi:glutamyl-tRNA synthetase